MVSPEFGHHLIERSSSSRLTDWVHDERALHGHGRSIPRVDSDEMKWVSDAIAIRSNSRNFAYLSTSLAIRPYETLDTPAHPYPSMVAPSKPSSPCEQKQMPKRGFPFPQVRVQGQAYHLS